MNSLKMSWGTIQHIEKKGNSKHTERVEASMLLPKGREESQSFRATSKLVPCVIREKKKFAQFQDDDIKRYKVSL